MNEREKRLLKASRNGCVSAFEELIKPHQTRVYNIMLNACHDKFEASQHAQEVFIRVFESIMKKDCNSLTIEIYKTAGQIIRSIAGNTAMIS